MSDSEVANDIVSVAAVVALNLGGPAVARLDADCLRKDIVIAIASARLDAIAAEREACARIVEKLAGADVVYPEGIRMIAAAIRARGST